MSKELPKVFANRIDKNIDNNKEYYVSKNEERKEKSIVINKNIKQKINEIFSSYKYVYKVDVVITVNGEEINKTLIGRNGNNLITIDNELININDIEDIRFQD